MKLRINKLGKQLLRWIPMVFALIIFLSIFLSLYFKLLNDCNLAKTLELVQSDILTISGILSAIMIAYLTSKVLQFRSEKLSHIPRLTELTQKVHKFRAIANKLIYSDLWPRGLPSFVNQDYKGLSHFDIREIIFVDAKVTEQATEFTEKNKYGGAANLFLELKTLVSAEIPFDETLYSEFDVPIYYKTDILKKWVRYDCGNGLWYYFSHKYNSYKEDLRLDNVLSFYYEDIKNLSIQIDKERYKDLEFGEELLAKLGTQFHSSIIPELLRVQLYIDTGVPKIVSYLFIILCNLISFGIVLPLITKIYSLSSIFEITSISVIVALCFYLITSFYSFLKRELTF